MADLFYALTVAGAVLLLTVLLPILSFVRAQQARRLAQEAQRRVASLEADLARLRDRLPREPPADITAAPPNVAAPVHQPVVSPLPATAAPIAERVPESRRAHERPAAAPAVERIDLEQQIGSRWMLYAGIAAVILGMSYFVKFAFDNGWISERLRVGGGMVIGLGLIAGGMRCWSRGLAPFGQALAGGGIVVLYVSIYAALHFYHLVAQVPAFGLMVLVTGVAVWLADRQRSQPLASLALLGGFATPLLVGGERGSQGVLFTYVAMLIAASAVLARRHAWPLLGAVSYLCTFTLVVAWCFASYEPADWLRTELFLTLYVTIFGYLLWTLVTVRPPTPQGQLAIAALATAPAAYHIASVALLNDRPAAWLLYLVLATAAGLAVSHRARSPWLRVLLLLSMGIPALAWLADLRASAWHAPAVLTAFVLYGLHLAGQYAAVDVADDNGLPIGETAHAQANGLLLPFSLYFFFENHAAAWNPWMVAALSGWNAALVVLTRPRAPHLALQFLTVSATLAASAVVLAFDGPAVAAGWAIEGIYLGWLAMRERRRAIAVMGGILIALGSHQLLRHLTSPLPTGDMPVLNARALAAALVIGLLAWLAWRIREDVSAEVRGRTRDALIILANVLGVLLLSAEIHAFFSQRAVDANAGGVPLGVAAAGLAEQLTLSVTWALYAVVLIAIGISRRYAPARYLAIALFTLTVGKVLVHDIAGLDRFHRMLTVLGVGVLLLVASYLYQRRTPDERTSS